VDKINFIKFPVVQFTTDSLNHSPLLIKITRPFIIQVVERYTETNKKT